MKTAHHPMSASMWILLAALQGCRQPESAGRLQVSSWRGGKVGEVSSGSRPPATSKGSGTAKPRNILELMDLAGNLIAADGGEVSLFGSQEAARATPLDLYGDPIQNLKQIEAVAALSGWQCTYSEKGITFSENRSAPPVRKDDVILVCSVKPITELMLRRLCGLPTEPAVAVSVRPRVGIECGTFAARCRIDDVAYYDTLVGLSQAPGALRKQIDVAHVSRRPGADTRELVLDLRRLIDEEEGAAADSGTGVYAFEAVLYVRMIIVVTKASTMKKIKERLAH
jgi:hypothetical protein